jgi:hypothetical protein
MCLSEVHQRLFIFESVFYAATFRPSTWKVSISHPLNTEDSTEVVIQTQNGARSASSSRSVGFLALCPLDLALSVDRVTSNRDFKAPFLVFDKSETISPRMKKNTREADLT